MVLADILGLIRAFLSAITFIPQVLLVFKTKSVGGFKMDNVMDCIL